MPRHVDHEGRRQQIVTAALAVLADVGPQALTFRSVAQRLGGSTTMITHYYPTRQDLLDALVSYVADWPEGLVDLEETTQDPRQGLRLFLRRMLPTNAQRIDERVRINLVGERNARLCAGHILDTWDANVCALLTQHVDGLVASDRVPKVVDLLRVVISGLVLSWVEHPADWSEERQLAVIDTLLGALDLTPIPMEIGCGLHTQRASFPRLARTPESA